MTLEILVAQFHARTLPREKWNHHAHLGVALWVLRRFDDEAALEHLRREIWGYNQSIGLENGHFSGYHETLAAFFARAVRDFLNYENEDNPNDEDALWAQLGEVWGDKNRVFIYYSRRVLMSPTARARWVAPDLRPFDFAPTFDNSPQ